MRALAIAATGMAAQQLNVEVIANNIANINTTGFKRFRAEFSDLLYHIENSNGSLGSAVGEATPESVKIGAGVRTASVRNLNIQGNLTQTGNVLDLAVQGRGLFRVAGPDGEFLYTRSGAWSRNASGQIVSSDGYALQPQMTVPAEAVSIAVNESGQVYAELPNDPTPKLLGQITLAIFPNEAGLQPVGGSAFRETPAAGAPLLGSPGGNGHGVIRQGYLEGSNVDAVKEITDLISAQRAYEMNSKVIQTVDDIMSIANKTVR